MSNELDRVLNSALNNIFSAKDFEGIPDIARSIYPKVQLLKAAQTQQSIDEQLKDLEGLLSQLRIYKDRMSCSDSSWHFRELLDCLFDRLFYNFRFKTINR